MKKTIIITYRVQKQPIKVQGVIHPHHLKATEEYGYSCCTNKYNGTMMVETALPVTAESISIYLYWEKLSGL